MTQHTIRRALVVSIALIVTGACGSGRTTTGTSSPAAADNEVVLHLIAYTPDTLEVAAGTTVTWRQRDAGFHTVTSGAAEVESSGAIQVHPDGVFRSPKLAEGERFSHAFADPGTFRYFCEVHPATMRGRIEVT